MGAGGEFLQTLSGEPHPRRRQSYYHGRCGEGKELLRDGKVQCFESIREGIRNQSNFIIQDTRSFISAPIASLVLGSDQSVYLNICMWG